MTEENRTYEFSYLITPTTSDTEIGTIVESLKTEIVNAGGEVFADQAPEYIDLAYTIEKSILSKKMKWSQGYFGWMKFHANPEVMEVLKKSFDANLEIMRYMLVKTDAENTVTFKKPKNEARRLDVATDEDIFENLEEEAEVEESTDEALEVHEKLPNLEEEM